MFHIQWSHHWSIKTWSCGGGGGKEKWTSHEEQKKKKKVIQKHRSVQTYIEFSRKPRQTQTRHNLVQSWKYRSISTNWGGGGAWYVTVNRKRSKVFTHFYIQFINISLVYIYIYISVEKILVRFKSQSWYENENQDQIYEKSSLIEDWIRMKFLWTC